MALGTALHGEILALFVAKFLENLLSVLISLIGSLTKPANRLGFIFRDTSA